MKKWDGVGICVCCRGDGVLRIDGRRVPGDRVEGLPPCDRCNGVGRIGLRPELPTAFEPGSDDKIAVLRARYAAGVPFWIPGDELDVFAGGLGEGKRNRGGMARRVFD